MQRAAGKNIVKKDEVIFSKGEPMTQVGILLAGKILVQNDYLQEVRTQGSFLALNDRNASEYQATYTALEDCSIYFVTFNGDSSIHAMIGKNGNFRAIMVTSQFKEIVSLMNVKDLLSKRAQRLFIFLKNGYEEYCTAVANAGISPLMLDELGEFKPYEDINSFNEELMHYFMDAAKIPLEVTKQYYSYSEDMVLTQVLQLSNLIEDCKEEIENLMTYIRESMNLLYASSSHNLYAYACLQTQEMRRQGDVPEGMIKLLKQIVEEVSYQNGEMRKQIPSCPQIDIEQMKAHVEEIISREMTVEEQKTQEEREERIKRDVVSLKNSMEQITTYAQLPQEQEVDLRTQIENFVKLSDRLSAEDAVKRMKKSIITHVFDLYYRCFKMQLSGKAMPKAVELFMNFGYIDERLLEEEQLFFLCSVEKEKNEGPCQVYTMLEWLELIYTGKREPSKNEFDEDYAEYLRGLRKQGEISDEEQKALFSDMDKRVKFEIQNMMKSNMRAIYAQPSTYAPILYKDIVYGYMDKMLITPKQVNESVEGIVKIDYSAFYREVVYSNAELKITNEMTQKNVYPDVILFPICGGQGSMWQEVGGKNKATPARFCIPILCTTSLDDIMLKMVGRFRWELCRCIQGAAWNDIKEKSLTSEYMDYIQFYKKNRELQEEAREKIKLQIQKSRNNSRETFLLDYTAWIKSEVNGSMKLNKVVRELMAVYCPFEKSIREKLCGQRPFELAYARFERERTKKHQELELKMKAWQKLSAQMPEEIMETVQLYEM